MNWKAESLTTEGRAVAPHYGQDLPGATMREEKAGFPAKSDAELRGVADQSLGPADDAWLDSMRRAIRSAGELRSLLGLPNPQASSSAEQPTEQDFDFPVFVPREFAARMRAADPHDPLLRQVLPSEAEGAVVAGFGDNPVGDLQANVAPGVLHKYAGRALVITTGACGVHCRYCFRRAFPYHEAGSRSQAYGPSLDYLRGQTDVEEVILSGGDPLTMTDDAFDRLLTQIEAIDHVRRLRIHSRMPIVIPSRVNRFLVERLKTSRLTAWMVVHSNHAAEIDEETAAALQRMVDAGIPVLNQAVLLRGVNDCPDVLEALSRAMIDCRVIPYYLHQLDRVTGAAHFEVSVERGRELIATLESRLPGFAVPRYVCETAGEKSKTRL